MTACFKLALFVKTPSNSARSDNHPYNNRQNSNPKNNCARPSNKALFNQSSFAIAHRKSMASLFVVSQVLLLAACSIEETPSLWRSELINEWDTDHLYGTVFDEEGATYQTVRAGMKVTLRKVSVSGSVEWQQDFTIPSGEEPPYSYPLAITRIEGGILLHNNLSSNISMVDGNGTVLWNFSFADYLDTLKLSVIDGNRIVVVRELKKQDTSDLEVTLLNDRGELEWSQTLAVDASRPKVEAIQALDNGSVFVLMQDDHHLGFQTLNAQGAPVSQGTLYDEFVSVLSVDANHIVVRAGVGGLERWRTDGTREWSQTVPGSLIRCSEAAQSRMMCSFASPAERDNQLVLFNLDDGTHSPMIPFGNRGFLWDIDPIENQRWLVREKVYPEETYATQGVYTRFHIIDDVGLRLSTLTLKPGTVKLNIFGNPVFPKGADDAYNYRVFEDQLIVSGVNGDGFTGTVFASAYSLAPE